MYVISNFVDVPEEVKRTRWSKEEKKFIFEKFSNTIKKYIQYMKGVDKSNQLISYYEINRKTYKWWKKIFYHLIDVSIVNSFIIFKKINNTSITQKNYRLEIVREIIKKYNKTIGNIKQNPKEIYYPVKHDKQLTCIKCSFRKNFITKKAPTTLYHCNICNINLCIDYFKLCHERKFK